VPQVRGEQQLRRLSASNTLRVILKQSAASPAGLI
jgi:hypothetical protein